MATQLRQIEPQPDDIVITGAMVVAEPSRGTVVLLDRARFEPFYDAIAQKARAFEADVSTPKGREALKSFVFQEITKVKTGLEGQANALTEEWRKNTNAVVQARNEIAERFKALAIETRKPLTDWENAEKARVVECETTIAGLKQAAVILANDTLETILARGVEVKATVIDAERYGSLFDAATEAKKAAFYALKEAHGRLTKEAEERAEAKRVADRLAQLEAENAAREEREMAEREAAEAAERERREAEEQRQREIEEARLAEERRIAAEKAEAERIRLAEESAATAAREEAARLAQEERDRERAEHEAALTREREAREKVEREAREAEEARIAEAARIEEERKLAEAAEAKRVANIQHRTGVRTGIEQAFMARGADDATAHKIAGDIIAGLIANIEVKF